MRFRWLFISLAVAGAVAVLGAAVYELWPRRHYNVLILTMESARAEVLSPEILPNVWRAAADGVRFDSHRAVSAWTAANIVSLLTGLSPFAHGIHSRDQHVPTEWRLPLKELAAAGWHTAGIQPFQKIEGFQALGLDIEPGANLLAWLAQHARHARPFVLWYHYLDTHLPYAPPPEFRPDLAALLAADDVEARERIEKVMTMPAIPAGEVAFRPSDRDAIRALYLGGFRAFDAWFAELWRFLEVSGLRDNTLIVLTADHGEEHLERGNVGHASTTRAGHLHEEVVRVPLVVWPPKSLVPGGLPRHVAVPTDHLDIMPTILAALGRSMNHGLAGRNLLARLDARPWRGITSEAGFAEVNPSDIRRFTVAVSSGKWKLHLIRDSGVEGAVQLYDLQDDPGETRNIAGQHPEVVVGLRDDVLPLVLSMRIAPPLGTPGDPAATPAPRWIFPAESGAYRYDDVVGRFRLEWAGRPDQVYRVQYEAGTGTLSLRGEFDVHGTTRDFGMVDRRYWNTWVVPYQVIRVRVGVPGRDDRWSDWVELRPAP